MERLKPGYPPNGTLDRPKSNYYPDSSAEHAKSTYGSPVAVSSLPREKSKGYQHTQQQQQLHPPGENTYYAYRVEQGPMEFDKRVVEGKVK